MSEQRASPDRQYEAQVSTDDETSLFLDCLYNEGYSIEESNETVADKIQQLEREMDKLSDKLKEAYFLALDQEIKQGTHYVRNKEILVQFLRSDKYNVPKAAMRMVNFFKHKLDLFGLEKLPRRILQDDLNEDDKKVLSSGFLHLANLDHGGRMVFLIQWDRLRSMGFLNDYFANSIKRVIFYYASFVETSEATQKDGIITIRWNFKSAPNLKDYRFMFASNQVMILRALPLRLGALHSCCSSPASKLCASLMDTFCGKFSDHYTKIHGPTAPACFAGLSKYGIDVDALLLTLHGDFKWEAYQEQLKSLYEREIPIKLREFYDSNQVDERKDILPSTTARQYELDRNEYEPKAPAIDGGYKLTKFSDTMIPHLKEEVNANVNEMKFDDVSEGAMKTHCAESVPGVKDSSSQNAMNYKNDEHLPVKLMKILQCDRAPDAIWWCNDGTSFAMHRDKLPKEILMQEFNGIRLDSFFRRLRRWGFKKMPKTSSTPVKCVEYEHPLFQKNSPELLNEWGNYMANKLSFSAPPSKEPPVAAENNDSSLQHPHLPEDSIWQSLAKEHVGDGHLPLKLMGILERNAAPDAIFWIRGGTAFAIEKDKFAKIVLPKEFNGIQMNSFLRGVRRWGFQRMPKCKTSLNCILFKHEQFQKNSPHLLKDWGKETEKDKISNEIV